jgi:hypothetical protein
MTDTQLSRLTRIPEYLFTNMARDCFDNLSQGLLVLVIIIITLSLRHNLSFFQFCNEVKLSFEDKRCGKRKEIQ